LAPKTLLPETGLFHWHQDLGALSVIGLTTHDERHHHRALTLNGRAILDDTLSSIDDQPVIGTPNIPDYLAKHLPWMPTTSAMASFHFSASRNTPAK
jgi:hypothetical protein